MFFPWFTTLMLAVESTSVITLRMAKIGRGGAQSFDEIGLMFAEKGDALLEAGSALMAGGTTSAMVDRYRVLVAANEARLSTRYAS